MSYSESVYSGMVPWQMRSENNPRYRPLAAFARCKSMDLPRELNDEEQAKKDDQERSESIPPPPHPPPLFLKILPLPYISHPKN